jgi:hypothetical protein
MDEKDLMDKTNKTWEDYNFAAVDGNLRRGLHSAT